MNQGSPSVLANHLGFAMKPDHPAVARHHAIGRAQRTAGKKHLGRFDAPALLVVGMDVAVPAHRIFQPFFLRKTQRRFDLRADVGFADSPIQIGHEHHGGNLFHQGAISGFQIGKLRIVRPIPVRLFRRINDAPWRWRDCSGRRLRPGPGESPQPARDSVRLGNQREIVWARTFSSERL